MDWDLAIKRNSEALKGIIAALFAMLGLVPDDTVSRLPQPLHRAVLRVLRPAESAVRRLIVIAARGLVVKVAPSRPRPEGQQVIGKGGSAALPSFQLFDTRKDFPDLRQRRVKYAEASAAHPLLRRRFPGRQPCGQQLRPAASPAPPVPMAWSTRRASPAGSRPWKLALEDLPRQARRLARWRKRQETSPNSEVQITAPAGSVRPATGGGRVHEVDELLHECQTGWPISATMADTS